MLKKKTRESAGLGRIKNQKKHKNGSARDSDYKQFQTKNKTKKFSTKVTKKDKKKFKPFLDTQKELKKGFSNTVSQKKFTT